MRGSAQQMSLPGGLSAPSAGAQSGQSTLGSTQVPQTQVGIGRACPLAADRNLVEVQRFECVVKLHLTHIPTSAIFMFF